MNKFYVVCGVNGGIGQVLAEMLLADGHDLLVTVRHKENLPASLKSPKVRCEEWDVTDAARIQSLFEALPETTAIAGLAYCIGSMDLISLRGATDDRFVKAFEVNVLGAVRILRAAEKMLKLGQGSVVLFSSIAAGQGFASHSIIGAVKGGVEGLARSLAAEWAPQARVNCIAPSLTKTPLAEKITANEKLAQAIAAAHPLNRLGEPQDVASLAHFLLSSNAGWITGQVMGVDGGRSHLQSK